MAKAAKTTTQIKQRSTAKKPVARRRMQTAPSSTGRFFRENARLLLTVFSAVVLGVLLFVSYQAATASSVFQTQKIDIEGANRAPVAAIETAAKRLTAKTGVWNADLDLIRREVEHLPWVKTATVSRVLPDGLRIRVTERNPVAVVRTENGKLVWVDDEAYILGVVSQNEQTPPFALIGWNESDSETARKNNIERLKLYLKLNEEFQQFELSNQITAVDLSDLQEVEVFVGKNGVIIPIQIGQTDFGTRLKLSLEVLDQTAQTSNLRDIEKLIAHGTRISIVPRKNSLFATNETGETGRDKPSTH